MKRSDATLETPAAAEDRLPPASKSNGSKSGKNGKPKGDGALDLSVILASLQTMRDGDFTVRLPGTWIGLAGKVADTSTEVVPPTHHMPHDVKHVSPLVRHL